MRFGDRGAGRRGARRRLLVVACAILALALVPPSALGGPAVEVPAGELAPRGSGGDAGDGRAADPSDFSLVGSLPLPGFNADVWGHRGFAYIGTWGSASNYPARCPATGVRIADLADPANPTFVGAVAAIPGTSQEDIHVASVATPAFTGDLLVTGIQACNRASAAPRGLDLWDVSDPRRPQHLAFWSSGPAGSGAQGGHELDLVVRGGRVYVGVTVPYAESFEGQGDFRLVDVTDPRNPVQVSSWGAARDGGIAPAAGRSNFGHGIRFNGAGTLAAVSYWDAGAILLDLADPARPVPLGRTPYPPGAVANHSSWFAAGETILLTADEYGGPQAGRWGGLRIWDIRDPRNPVEIGQFLTPNAAAGLAGGGFQYTIHNPIARGTTAYLSWYGDGMRVLDIADPRAPREIGSFVPPAAADPYGYHPTAPMVWGVYAEGDLLLLSDINAGLYVLRNPFAAPACFAETGRCVGGRFLDYWRANGGLAVNGFPISGEFEETLEDGKRYTVQYFERTRLEYHPEAPEPYTVQLGQFGRRIRGGADPPAARLPDTSYFTETGHNLGGRFRDYWQANGGLAQFGFPISEVIAETLEDGKRYEVQYFERARFEYHPENAGTPYEVLLGQFGRRILGAQGGR
jgi:hypothetical protein